LDAIISNGYRISSNQAILFCIWATERLKEYIIKGSTMDDERLKLYIPEQTAKRKIKAWGRGKNRF